MLGFTLVTDDPTRDHRTLMEMALRLFPQWEADIGEEGFVIRCGARFIRVVSFGTEAERAFYEEGELDGLPMQSPRFALVSFRQPVDGRLFLKALLLMWPAAWVDNDYVFASGTAFREALRVAPLWSLTGPLPTTSSRSSATVIFPTRIDR